jgi:histidyl-tRNA synthetase
MSSLRTVRGTRDLLPEDSRRHRWIEATAWRNACRLGYGEVATPVFEFTEVFSRTLGDTSDVVTKEMYTFEDRGGDSLTLRPENTAGIVRAFISNNLGDRLPARIFYRGPMFRYERPQKGRLRQFHQVGVELLGTADPGADVEVIALADAFLQDLGLAGTYQLEINTLGDTESRTAYRNRLVEWLQERRSALSADSLTRLERNPLRILDSKDPQDRRLLEDAPHLSEHLTERSRGFFSTVLRGLDDLGLQHIVNPRLVRGLDYYTDTTFEFTTQALGAQGTLLAGGRYDGLVEQMGGRPTPGIGWAAGIERLAELAPAADAAARPIAMITLGEAAFLRALRAIRADRRDASGHPGPFQFGFGTSLGKQLKWANRINARIAVIIGSEELAREQAIVRDMDTGTQQSVPLAELMQSLPHGA